VRVLGAEKSSLVLILKLFLRLALLRTKKLLLHLNALGPTPDLA